MFRHLHLSVVSDPYLRLKTDENGILKTLECTEAEASSLPPDGDKKAVTGLVDSDNSRGCMGCIAGIYHPVGMQEIHLPENPLGERYSSGVVEVLLLVASAFHIHFGDISLQLGIVYLIAAEKLRDAFAPPAGEHFRSSSLQLDVGTVDDSPALTTALVGCRYETVLLGVQGAKPPHGCQGTEGLPDELFVHLSISLLGQPAL